VPYYLTKSSLAEQTISPILTHSCITWDVYRCLSHSCAMLKRFDIFRCHIGPRSRWKSVRTV